MVFFGGLPISIIFGYITYIIMKRKGYGPVWFVVGMIFGIFAVIYAVYKPSNDGYTDAQSYREFIKNENGAAGAQTNARPQVHTGAAGARTNARPQVHTTTHYHNNNCQPVHESADALAQYKRLYEAGVITREEYEERKRKMR